MLAALIASSSFGVLLADDAAEQIGPGLLAFVIVVLLAIATFLLIRSMLFHIRKVPPTFDDEDSAADRESDSDASGPGVS